MPGDVTDNSQVFIAGQNLNSISLQFAFYLYFILILNKPTGRNKDKQSIKCILNLLVLPWHTCEGAVFV